MYFNLSKQNYLEVVADDPGEQILEHLYLAQLSHTRRILEKSEFDTAFAKHPGLHPRWRERLQAHMENCPIFFQRTFQEVIDAIHYILCFDPRSRNRTGYTGWILKMINILENVRIHFPFCSDCEYKTEQNCSYWKGIFRRLKVISIMHLNN